MILDIDVEGMDLDVLKSNNWLKYRPKLILVEILDNNLDNIKKNPVVQFMQKQNYIIFSKLDNTLFFKDMFIKIKY